MSQRESSHPWGSLCLIYILRDESHHDATRDRASAPHSPLLREALLEPTNIHGEETLRVPEKKQRSPD